MDELSIYSGSLLLVMNQHTSLYNDISSIFFYHDTKDPPPAAFSHTTLTELRMFHKIWHTEILTPDTFSVCCRIIKSI